MARMARVVVPHCPHHVTQRGNRKQKTFFYESDYREYMRFLIEAKNSSGVEIWAYCLMPNHIHIVVVPEHRDSLSEFFGCAHRRYTRMVNTREGWQGHLWQERFHSFAMDEHYLYEAVKYVELNPVRAKLCHRPDLWMWSSVHAHLNGRDDELVNVKPMLKRVGDWCNYLKTGSSEQAMLNIQNHGRTGRPLGDNRFVRALERVTGRRLQRGKPGPKSGK